jgi:ferric-dicitrate binding protein FerR (iron transport regulator)
MDERWEEIERELQRLRPAALPARLAERLREEPEEERLTIGDRVLAAVAGCGAMAACVIVGLLMWQLSLPAPPQPSASDLAARQKLAAEYQQLLAAR